MKKRFSSVLLAVSMLLTLFPSAAPAAQAAGEVIEIGTPRELRQFAAEVNGGTHDYAGTRILLTADIDLGGSANPWTPISPSGSRPFNGSFDGNGHVITGLYSIGSYGGLFHSLGSEGVVENLGVYGIISGGSLLGGIAAINQGVIRSCFNGCFIAGNTLVGGIAGGGHGYIENCYNIGTISGSFRVGGIIGMSLGQLYGQTGLVKNCYNFGPVSGQDPDTTGAVVGTHNTQSSTVTGCHYLSGTADKGSNHAGEATEETAVRFARQSTFSGWDFTGVWEMSEPMGRPVLRTVPEALPPTEHTHSYPEELSFNEKEHWYTCIGCGVRKETADHRYSASWDSDSGSHWRACLDCGYQSAASHTAAVTIPSIPSSCTTPGATAQLRCTVCDALLQESSLLEPMGHSYPNTWEKDADHHWRLCARCGERADYGEHTWREAIPAFPSDYIFHICTQCFARRKVTVPLFPISVLSPQQGGTLSATRTESPQGGRVMITVTPEEDYMLDVLTVTDSDGRELPLTRTQEAGYRFTMPACPVTVTASFRLFIGPSLAISVPPAPVRNQAVFTLTPTYKGEPLSWDAVELPEGDLAEALGEALRATGTVAFRSSGLTAQEPVIYTVSGLTGDGFLYFDLPAGLLRYREVDSSPVLSAQVCVDNTPPVISLQYPQTSLPLRVGEEYVEYGALVTDKLDPDIQSKLTIDNSQVDTSVPGTYSVFYTAVDHAGNSAAAERLVEVVACPGHVEDQGSITRPATETEAGVRTYFCQLCHCTMRTEDIPPHSHHAPWSTENGTHWRWCAVCKDKVDTDSCRFVPDHLEAGTDGTVIRVLKCLVCGAGERRDTLKVQYLSTAEELRQIADDVNIERNQYRDTCFVLKNDIDLGGKDHPWVPIGTNDPPYDSLGIFRGVFDGDGHSITGLYIDLDADIAEQYEQGFFGFLGSSALIQNLSVSGSITVTESETWGPASEAGGIAATNYGMIQNCRSTCNITNTLFTGGIAGLNKGRILNCYNTGDIFATMFPDDAFAGGIVGDNAPYAIVENCYNYGLVQGHAENMGGISGFNDDNTAQVISSYYLSGTVDSAPSARFAAPMLLSTQAEPSGGESLAEIEFILEDSFSGWDFQNVWAMNSSLGRPTLRSVPEEVPSKPPVPENPDQPDKPDDPDKPDKPDTPVKPDTPDKPGKPDTPSGGSSSGGGSSGGGSSGGSSSGGSSSDSGNFSSGGGASKPAPSPALPEKQDPPTVAVAPLAFSDVRPGAWYYDAVTKMYAAGIMTGVTKTSFAPEAPASRGMVVAMLHRMEKEPSASGGQFTDVTGQMYFSKAVTWASGQSIVTGYGDDTFRPNAPVTREQLAVMLFRYARYKGQDTTARAALSGYRDMGQISGYALEAMSWANALGILTGTDWGGLAPQTETTRAECAAILSRFLASMDRQ